MRGPGLGLGLGGQGGGGFQPVQLGGCVLWLRADRGVTQSSGSVSAWADQSGSGRNFSQGTGANQPSYQATAGPNAQPAIVFNGTSDLMTCATSVLGLATCTVFLVLQYSATPATYATVLAWQDTGGSAGVEIGSDGTLKRYVGAPNVGEVSDGAVTTSAEKWTIQNNSSTWSLRVNGSSQSLSGNPMTPLSGTAGSILGARPGGSLFFKGALSEAIAYSGVLSAAQVAQVEGYLKGRYGL